MFNQYGETLDYLYSRLPMFSRIGKAALKPDLTNTIKLCTALGNPQHKFRSVHIAGTNGKGSTSHALSAVFQEAGYVTGLYTSPHLVDFRERIKINGQMISRQWVVDFVNQHRQLIEEINPSFFEITVAMAFQAFAEAGVDVAIIETGLGGRLDSTNVITPLLSVITNISYDHKDLLGDTLAQIASEKAGIIKPDVPVIIGEQHDETQRVFFETSVHRKSPLIYAQSLWELVRVKHDSRYQYFKAVDKATQQMVDLTTDLQGNYQQHNLKTVLTAAALLNGMGYSLPLDTVIAALGKVQQLTGLTGRWQWLNETPPVICDVAHNAAGLAEVLGQWKRLKAAKKHIIIGFVKDKDIAAALAQFPPDNIYYYCNAAIERALPVGELAIAAWQAGLSGTRHPSVLAAYNAARAEMAPDDALLITGSFFTIGELLENLQPVATGQ
jgi:dihydrofolate synthase/folylpolyglutamate synthase